MPACSVYLVRLFLSEAGPGRFGRQVSVTDIYHTDHATMSGSMLASATRVAARPTTSRTRAPSESLSPAPTTPRGTAPTSPTTATCSGCSLTSGSPGCTALTYRSMSLHRFQMRQAPSSTTGRNTARTKKSPSPRIRWLPRTCLASRLRMRWTARPRLETEIDV